MKSLYSISIVLGFFFLNPTFAETKTQLDLAKSKSSVEFLAVGNPSALKIKGKLKESDGQPALSGTLTADAKGLTGKAVCRMEQIDTGIELRNRHMKEKYLEIAKHPEGHLEITKLNANLSDKEWKGKDLPFEGTLTLHGVKKPVQGTVEVEKEGEEAELSFQFKVKVSDFAIESPSFMGITMADEVTVNVKVEGKLL